MTNLCVLDKGLDASRFLEVPNLEGGILRAGGELREKAGRAGGEARESVRRREKAR